MGVLRNDSAWAVLGNRIFRSLWIANVASGVGTTMHDTAAVWTMATLTSSPTLVALMQTMSSLPLFLFALPAGALADIVDRRKVVIGAQLGSLVVAGALSLLALLGALTPAILLSATFLLGLGVAFTAPTWQAILPEVVGKKDLAPALTLGSIGINISRAIGPVIGGLLLATVGPAAAFLLNAVSFVGIIIVLWRWKRPEQKAGAESERMLGAMVAAMRFLRHSPAIQAVLIRNAMFTFFGIAPMALLPIIVKQRQLGSADFGILMGTYGLGGILAAFLLLPKLREKFSADQIAFGANVLFAGMAVLLAFVQQRWVLALVLLVAGGAWLSSMSTFSVAAQSAFPNWVRARSSAIHLLAMQSAWAVGALVWGKITEQWNAPLALCIAGGGIAVTLLFVRLFPLNRAMTADVSPSTHWAPHTLSYEPAPDDGPVLVAIDYHVEPANAERFLAAIARLRSIRLRDGAFRWSVFQELNEAMHFRESFQVGSWAEHLRQHSRATADDRRAEEEVIALHTGAEPPRVSHYLMKDVLKTKPVKP